MPQAEFTDKEVLRQAVGALRHYEGELRAAELQRIADRLEVLERFRADLEELSTEPECYVTLDNNRDGGYWGFAYGPWRERREFAFRGPRLEASIHAAVEAKRAADAAKEE